ncbi:MAG: hypothetical protein LBT80_04930 [Lactobacillaceae bacterium]|jgi:hypothetical protein|nr:hypothetical protein [Lactobacillaceae bacterium]
MNSHTTLPFQTNTHQSVGIFAGLPLITHKLQGFDKTLWLAAISYVLARVNGEAEIKLPVFDRSEQYLFSNSILQDEKIDVFILNTEQQIARRGVLDIGPAMYGDVAVAFNLADENIVPADVTFCISEKCDKSYLRFQALHYKAQDMANLATWVTNIYQALQLGRKHKLGELTLNYRQPSCTMNLING